MKKPATGRAVNIRQQRVVTKVLGRTHFTRVSVGSNEPIIDKKVLTFFRVSE
jgi:hypothetical protein